MYCWERSSADGHARCKHTANVKVEGGTNCLCDLCRGTGHRIATPVSGTNGRGREVLGKITPGNYNLGTLQDFTRGTVSEWPITHTTSSVLLQLLVLSAPSFVQDSARSCSGFECFSAQLNAELGWYWWSLEMPNITAIFLELVKLQ